MKHATQAAQHNFVSDGVRWTLELQVEVLGVHGVTAAVADLLITDIDAIRSAQPVVVTSSCVTACLV